MGAHRQSGGHAIHRHHLQTPRRFLPVGQQGDGLRRHSLPLRADILKELRDACDVAGIKLCFYHSIMDWHHPTPRARTMATQSLTADFADYRENYLKPQLRELVEKYNPSCPLVRRGVDQRMDGRTGRGFVSIRPQPQTRYPHQQPRRQGMQGMNREPDDVGDFGTPEQEILDYGSVKSTGSRA